MGASSDIITHKENMDKKFTLEKITHPVIGKGKKKIKIVSLSDTHENHLSAGGCIPDSFDIFIYAGDFTNWNDSNDKRMFSFLRWVKSLNAKYSLIVGGNHDFCFSKKKMEEKMKIFEEINNEGKGNPNNKLIYLENTVYKIPEYNLTFFGFPHTVRRNIFYRGSAFEISGKEMNAICNQNFNEKIDIIISHSPPYDIMDIDYKNRHYGSTCVLFDLILRVKPKLHIFGHNHDKHGFMKTVIDGEECLFLNASITPHSFKYCYDE